MKKVLSTIVAILLAAPTFAQYSSGGFSLDEENLYYGVRLGMSVSSISGDIPEVEDLGSKVGLTLGGIIGLRCSHSAPVFLESGVFYTERGAKKGKSVASYNTLEIPLLVKYGIKVSDDIALLPFLGPTFSYAVSGKYKGDKAYVDGAVTTKTVDTGAFEEKEWSALRRANMGIKFGCGAEYSNIYLEVAYQLGITDVCKNNDHTGHSNAFLINFGVNF